MIAVDSHKIYQRLEVVFDCIPLILTMGYTAKRVQPGRWMGSADRPVEIGVNAMPACLDMKRILVHSSAVFLFHDLHSLN